MTVERIESRIREEIAARDKATSQVSELQEQRKKLLLAGDVDAMRPGAWRDARGGLRQEQRPAVLESMARYPRGPSEPTCAARATQAFALGPADTTGSDFSRRRKRGDARGGREQRSLGAVTLCPQRAGAGGSSLSPVRGATPRS
jgi:hypothetical protein